MQCSSCGNVLSPGVRICPACGAFAPPAAMPPPPTRTVSFYDEQIPFTDRETPVRPPAPPVLPAPPASPTPSMPLRTGEMNATPLPLPSTIAPPSHPTRLIVLASTISIVALLVIGVLVILLVRATNASNSNLANKQASPTQTSSSVTNDPQALYNQVMSTTPAVDDAFNNTNGSNWISATTTEGSTCTVASDRLQTTATQGDSSICALSTRNVSNFACQVQATLTQGDSTGLVFRANTTTLNIYVLEISTQGTYILESGQSGSTSSKTLSQGSSSALKMGYGQSNLIAVIAQGSNIYVYFNKEFIVHVNDDTSSSGLVGTLSSGSISNVPVNANFSHFQLWNL